MSCGALGCFRYNDLSCSKHGLRLMSWSHHFIKISFIEYLNINPLEVFSYSFNRILEFGRHRYLSWSVDELSNLLSMI